MTRPVRHPGPVPRGVVFDWLLVVFVAIAALVVAALTVAWAWQGAVEGPPVVLALVFLPAATLVFILAALHAVWRDLQRKRRLRAERSQAGQNAPVK